MAETRRCERPFDNLAPAQPPSGASRCRIRLGSGFLQSLDCDPAHVHEAETYGGLLTAAPRLSRGDARLGALAGALPVALAALRLGVVHHRRRLAPVPAPEDAEGGAGATGARDRASASRGSRGASGMRT
jgi:hypothetical protein